MFHIPKAVFRMPGIGVRGHNLGGRPLGMIGKENGRPGMGVAHFLHNWVTTSVTPEGPRLTFSIDHNAYEYIKLSNTRSRRASRVLYWHNWYK